MTDITVITHIHARPGKEAMVARELEKLIAPTREEASCHQYDMLSDARDPTHFVFLQKWTDAAAHQAHLDSEHMSTFVVNCKGAIAEATVYHLDPVE